MSTSGSSTFNCLHERPEASVRLLCFPWAGGGSSVYAKWGEFTDSKIEVVAIRIPGREKRRDEPFATNVAKLCEDLADEIYDRYTDKPFAFLGHSMGLTLAYETARVMVDKYTLAPVHIFFSGTYAPHSEERKRRLTKVEESEALHNISDEDLLSWVAKHGGTPQQLLDNTEFMKTIFIPVFRADLKMMFHYYRDDVADHRFQMGITFMDGDKDADHLHAEFKELTSGKFTTMFLPGGHFYLLKEENRKIILDYIAQVLLAKIDS